MSFMESTFPTTLFRYDAADIAEDEQYKAREMVQWVDDAAFGKVLHPGAVPSFGPGTRRVRWPGPAVGAHNADVYGGLLGLDARALADLAERKVI